MTRWEVAPNNDCEPSLDELPLPFLGCFRDEADPFPTVVISDESRRCFSFQWPKVLNRIVAHNFFENLRDLAPWQDLLAQESTRAACWYTRSGCRCDYVYGNQRLHSCCKRRDSTESILKFNNLMETITDKVFSTMCPELPHKCWPNSASLHLHSTGSEGGGWQTDNDPMFCTKYDCPVVFLSLGGQRKFGMGLKPLERLRDRDGCEPVPESVVEVDLANGDVLTMEGLFQKHCVYHVSREHAAVSTPRINITWRWICEHSHKCPRSPPPNFSGGFGVKPDNVWDSLEFSNSSFLERMGNGGLIVPGGNFKENGLASEERCKSTPTLANLEENIDPWSSAVDPWAQAQIHCMGMEVGTDKRRPTPEAADGDDPVSVFVKKWDLDDLAERMLRESSSAVRQQAMANFCPPEGKNLRNISARFVAFLTKRVSPPEGRLPPTKFLPEDSWERYVDPETRRTWLWCPSTGECFFSDNSSGAGWEAFWYRDVGIWWWHATSGRCFVESTKVKDGSIERLKKIAQASNQTLLYWQRIIQVDSASVRLSISPI